MSQILRTANVENWVAETRRRLAARSAKKPDTKARQIQALWPEIAAAIEKGQSMKSICQFLEQDAGITVGTTTLTSALSRIRRREAAKRKLKTNADLKSENRGQAVTSGQSKPLREDPLGQAMRALSKPRFDIREIHGDGDPSNQKLI